MAASSKRKVVKRAVEPKGRSIGGGGDPAKYYFETPAWAFNSTDKEAWPFNEERLKERFWTEILPRLRDLESQRWQDILLRDKKFNHSLDLNKLNKKAQDRLSSLHIEAESLISLRISSTHRLYGYMTGRVFNIVWYDDDHGDNDKCVCRAQLKHT